MTSKKYRHRITGEIVTQIPVLELHHYEPVSDAGSILDQVISVDDVIEYKTIFGKGPPVLAMIVEMTVTPGPREKGSIKDPHPQHVQLDLVIKNRVVFTVRNYRTDNGELSGSLNWCYSEQIVCESLSRVAA